ncbi:hypothetical protein [Ureibacillus aquaedulcis]|uniref:Uncharacterized protein n=1 Tax=Ureibacillus aquaedulcis TaxID=3058421 RepID=A0ABT8GKK4_9BACL|nr:hypothetical protein [Ureibacillus sp. BA0131]MDN4491940.1 hypothetical protein [Ureibacillus sp. BA0131]
MYYYYNPEVKYLLINRSNEKEVMYYQSMRIKVPKIGPRPPYYIHPRYEHYYPVI